MKTFLTLEIPSSDLRLKIYWTLQENNFEVYLAKAERLQEFKGEYATLEQAIERCFVLVMKYERNDL